MISNGPYSISPEYLLNCRAVSLLKTRRKADIKEWLSTQKPEFQEAMKVALNNTAPLLHLKQHIRTTHMYSPDHDFLTYWKKGIELTAHQMFNISPALNSHQDATHKWQLQPASKQFINEYKAALNNEQCKLLAVMCSIYRPGWGGELCGEWDIRSPADLIGLPPEFKDVVFGLISTYEGW